MATAARSAPTELRRFLHEVSEGARRQANVVFALIFKEFKNRAGRDNRLGMVWILFDPVSMVVFMSSFWYMMGRTTIAGVNVALFIAIATVPYLIVSMALGSVQRSLKNNRMFYNYQQVKPFDSVLAEFVLEVTLLMIGETALFFVLWWFFDLSFNVTNIMPLLGILCLAMATSFGIALAVATYSALYDPVAKVVSILSRPLFFVSAVFYTPNGMPAQARYLLSWNPIVQLVEYARLYALDIKLFQEASIGYAVVFAIAALFLGLVSYYPNRQRLLRT